MIQYPIDITTYGSTDQRLHVGHGLDADMLRADLVAELGPPSDGQTLVTEEVHLAYKPRVKNCSRYDGWGCDQEGDWHAHWNPVKPHPDAAYTLAWWGPTTEGDR